MKRLAKDRTELNKGLVDFYWPSSESLPMSAGDEQFRTVCMVTMQTLLDPSFRESLGAMEQIKVIHQELAIQASNGLYGELQKPFYNVLNNDLKAFMLAMDNWSKRIRDEVPIGNAIAALSNDETTWDKIVDILTRFMQRRGSHCNSSYKSLVDQSQIEEELVTLLSALDEQSADIIAQIVSEISRTLLYADELDDPNSSESALLKAVEQALGRFIK